MKMFLTNNLTESSLLKLQQKQIKLISY